MNITGLINTADSPGEQKTIYVVKIGGNIIDNDQKLSDFLKLFAAIPEYKILVHGGGKLATRLAEQMNIPQQMVDGRRITDSDTLRIVTMVYAGYINKNIVALLQAQNCNAIGLSGADGNSVRADKRTKGDIDYGFAGDVREVNGGLVEMLLKTGLTPVIAPITHNGHGQLLNTNADTIAQELSRALTRSGKVVLVYSFEKAGVLRNADDESTVISEINPTLYEELKEQNVIFAGMIPKLDNSFAAIESGVGKVIIGKAEELDLLISGKSGTAIVGQN